MNICQKNFPESFYFIVLLGFLAMIFDEHPTPEACWSGGSLGELREAHFHSGRSEPLGFELRSFNLEASARNIKLSRYLLQS